MIDIRSALQALLLSDATVSGLVGALRVYPGVLPQGQVNASAVYNLISEQTDYHMESASGLAWVRMQVAAWAQTQDAAVTLANAIKDKLSGFRGAVAYGSASPQVQVVINGIFAEQSGDDFDSVAKLHARRRDYIVWYWER